MTAPSRLNLPWINLAESSHLDRDRLVAAARDIEVSGIPLDLIKLIQRREPIAVIDALWSFYLPNLLTYAYLRFGLERGILREEALGLCVEPAHRIELLSPRFDRRSIDAFFDHFRGRTKLQFYQDSRSHLDAEILSAVSARGDLWQGMRALCVGDGEGTPLWLKDVGIEDVWAVDIDPDIAAYYSARGVRTMIADSRFSRDCVLGAFDLVRTYQIEGAQDECIRRMAYANLKAYGVYYTYVVGHENARHRVFDFIHELDHWLVVTDVLQHRGSFVIRAVKVPEIEAFYRTRKFVRSTPFDHLLALVGRRPT